MKVNYIVSNLKEFWISNRSHKLIAEPFVAEELRTTGMPPGIEVAGYPRNGKRDLIEASNFVFRKYHQYTPILADRLNHIHGKDYPVRYWQRALSLPFVRYITLVHSAFSSWESTFKPEIHGARVLSEKSFYIPETFERQREFLQATDLGQEQLFSIYLNTFYPGNCEGRIYWEGFRTNRGRPSILRSLVRRIRRGKAKQSNIPYPRQPPTNDKLQVGLLGVFFSKESVDELRLRSEGKIDTIQWPQINIGNDVNTKWRTYLSKCEPSFDSFDTFFFQTLYSLFPKFFLEQYAELQPSFHRYFDSFPHLKTVVSECWIFSTPAAFAIAELSHKRNIRHISCEHNVLSHPMAGHYVEYLAPLCDEYWTIGWDAKEADNIYPAASLLPFYHVPNGHSSSSEELWPILYISGAAQVKLPLYWSQYGLSAENVQKHFDFVLNFFNNLPSELISKIHYRPYPKKSNQLLLFDKEALLKDFPLNFADNSENSRVQMARSNLVVVDYLSTAHLEAISMNVPTIFFFNRDCYFLRDNYADFFDSLIDAGVCQTDPKQAAAFVTQIFQDPMKWWTNPTVQEAVRSFLAANLGRPEVMINKLLQQTK